MSRKLAVLAGVLVAALLASWWLRSKPATGDGARAPSPATSRVSEPARGTTSALDRDASPPRRAGESAPTSARSEPAASGDALRGCVLDTVGLPIAGARVRVLLRLAHGLDVLDAAYRDARRPLAETTTSSEGRFSIPVPARAAFDVLASASGFAPGRFDGVLAGDELVFRLGGAARLAGGVRARSSPDPLPGVWLGVRSRENGALLAETTTDGNGVYAFDELPALVVTLHARSADHALPAPALLELRAGEQVLHDVELDAGVLVTGRVLDATSHAGIARARVATDWIAGKQTEADERGEFALLGFSGRRLFARAEGYAGALRSLEDEPATDFVVDFELVRGRTLRGRIVDASGAPRADAYVAAVSDDAGPAHRSRDWRAERSADDGRFAIAGLDRSGRHALLVHVEGFGTASYDLPSDEHERDDVDVGDVAIRPSGAIAGRVVSASGLGLSGFVVLLEGANADHGRFAKANADPVAAKLVARRVATTDSNGGFLFPDLASGRYRVSARPAGGSTTDVLDVELTAPELRTVRLAVDTGASLSGRVETPEGAGLPGIVLVASPSEGGAPARTRSGADGRFVFVGLQPDEYDLFADPLERNRMTDDLRSPARVEEVSAGGGDVRVVLPPADTIRGTVLDARGAPATSVVVTAYAADEVIAEARTNGRGRFELLVPKAVACRVAARAEGSTRVLAEESSVPAGRSDLSLREKP